jgi:DNA-binding CsgD family transcriptional regulator
MSAGGSLIEREGVLRAATRLVDDLRQGRGGVLFVTGEAGLGKTAVLNRARRLAGGAGLPVAEARGHPMESALPFGLMAQALAGVGGRGLLGEDRPGTASDRSCRFYRVLRWLEERGQPVLFALDDLQWADAESLSLAVFLCRRAAVAPLAVIATARPWPAAAHDAALSLADEASATVQRLAPLSAGAARALLEDRTGRPLPAGLRRRAFELSAGNPVLLEHVATAVSQEEDIPEAGWPGTRWRRHGLVPERFAGLSPEGMRCAQAAAVLGNRFRPDIAAQVAALADDDGDAALESLDRSGLIEQAGSGEADFVHPLFRQALYDGLAGTTRTRLHARAFAVCAARGLEAMAAEHAIRASMAGDPVAVAVLERAGRAALQAGAPGTAAVRLDAAVALAGDQASVPLLLAQAGARLIGSSPDRAVTAYERILGRLDTPASERVEALWMLGRSLMIAGMHERAAAAFEEAVGLALPVDPGTAVEVLLDAAYSSCLTAGPAEALPIAGRAAALAAPLGPELQTKAEAEWGRIALQAGNPEGMAATERAAQSRRTAPHPRWNADGVGLFGALGWVDSFAYSACLAERFGESDRAFSAARAAADGAGHPAAIAVLAVGHACTLTRMGRLVEALEAVDVATSLSELVPLMEASGGAVTALIHLYMGRLDDSAHWCRRAEAAATARGEWSALISLWDVLGHRCLREGAVSDACDLYARLETTANRIGLGEPCLPAWGRHGVSAYLAAGRLSDAERLLGWLDQCADRLACRYPRIAAAAGRAQIAELNGKHDEADAYFRTALALHDEVDLPLEKAETLLGYGAFLRRTGRPALARPLLTAAIDTADVAGAGWLGGMARDELRVAGGRRRRRLPTSLTAQEMRVAGLVATGASNPQIARQLYISVSTIETHLERIYSKLGIRSRHELMALAAARKGIAAVGHGHLGSQRHRI